MNSKGLPRSPAPQQWAREHSGQGNTEKWINTKNQQSACLAAQRLELLDAVREGDDLGGAHKAAAWLKEQGRVWLSVGHKAAAWLKNSKTDC